MKFSSDITSFKLGAATVNRTDNGWAVTQGEDTVYTVDSFTQNGDEYTVEFSTPENTSHFETIAINATDEYGNTSKDIPYTLRFDKQNPEVTTISGGNEIRDIDSQMSVFISDTNSDSIIIKAIPNDIYDDAAELSSGISGGVLTFSDSKEKYNANLDNGVLVFKVPNTARAEKFTITVTDNAKNEDTFSFNTGENHVSKSDSALFVVDKCAPEITSAISKPDNCIETTLNGNQTWYNSYPALSFKVKDHLSEKCKDKSCKETVSGLNTITITYIGKDGKNYDLKTDAKGVSLFSGMLYICDNDEDPNAVDITLIGNDESDEPIITVPKNKSGKFEFVIKSSDRSDRVNEEAAPVFYVDNKHPYAEDILSVKSKNSKEFGTFSNEDIIIEAVIHDDDPSSGMKSATLKVGTKSFPGKFIGNNKWQFKIASEFAPVSGDISIIMLDNAGNEHETKTVRNPEGSNFLMIENTKPEVFPKPVITAVSGNNTPYISKNKNNDECKWYSGDVDLEFWWKDSDSGMDISSVRIENKEKKTVTYSDDFTFSNKAGSKWINRFDTSYIKIRTPENEDGKITFFFEGTDNCGNKAETKETVYKDITAPKITSVTTANDDIPNLLPFRELNTGNSADNLQRYDYFSNKQIKLTIKAEDLNASSGLDYIRYKIYNHDGTLINSDTKKFTNDTITIDKISENFKGYITAQAFDNVGNSSQTACVYGMISENEECHLENSSIRINLPDSEYTDEKGNMLYSHDINVNISAEDTYSGINKISWRISNDSEGYFEENEIGYNNILNGKEIFGEWLVYGYEKNLATKLTSGISEQNNANGLKMDVSFTDNTGHSLSKSVTYSIDKDKPELTAAFLPSHYDEQYTNIFNAPRTAVINIKERNFNPDDTYIDAPGANIGSFSLVSGKEGTKEACYEAKVTFENDGEYKYSAISYDKCKNESNRYESETFIIDRTAPKISVDFGDTASNGKYFNSSRTAVITVVEQNFDENRIKVSATLNGKTDKLPKLSSWTHNGNVHTAQMVFTEAGEYTFSVSGSDKASNAAEEIYTTEFTIDKTLPNITFRGLKDKSANRGSSAFSVRITDKYLDLDSVNVRIDGAKRGENIKINSKKKNLKNGVEFTFDNLPKEQKYDDVYHVTATAKDKAGNPIEKTLDFSVNRFGSTYIFDEATQKISRKYVKEPVDVVIHEINPDKLDPEKTLVVFAKDGISHIMNENEGFTLDVTGGNGKWYDYQYTLGVENFREDGAYYIMMYSQDVAGNANTNQEESQNAELRFGIDSTPPHLASVDLQTNGSYRAKDYYTARIRTVDLMFKELHVYLNDSETEEQTTFVDEYTYTFEVPAMEAPQKIRVVGYDYAGNRSEIEVTNVLVNPSIFKVLMRKSWFHLILAGIAGLIGWGLSKFIKRQKAIHDMAVKLQLK